MSKAAYIGVEGVARKVKKMYIGVDGVAREVKKAYVGAPNFPPRDLPDGHTQLEYIESTGTQYIDTAFIPNQDSRVVLDAQIMKAENVSDLHCYFGSRDVTNKKDFELYNSAAANFNIYFLYGSTYTKQFSVDLLKRRTVEINKNTATVDGESYSYTPVDFNVGYPIYIGADNNSGSPNAITPMRTYACQMYGDGAFARDYVPDLNPDGEVGLYDMVTGTFFGNAGTGTFIAGPTLKSVARLFYQNVQGISAAVVTLGAALTYNGSAQTKQVASVVLDGVTLTEGVDYTVSGNTGTNAGNYTMTITGMGAYEGTVTKAWSIAKATGSISVNPTSLVFAAESGTTKTATIAYAGDGGISVASSATSIATVSRSGTTITVKFIASGSATITIALAAGANYTGASCNITVKGTTYLLSVAREQHAAVSVGNYALFGGGTDGSTYPTSVDAFNESLTRSAPAASIRGRIRLEAVNVGSYGLFVGGYAYNSGSCLTTVDAYNESLTRSTPTALSTARCNLGTAKVGQYALVAGGNTTLNGTPTNVVDAYNESLTRSKPTALSVARSQIGGASVGAYALFAGGIIESTTSNVVDAYNESLTRSTPTALSDALYRCGAASVGNYALFAGGQGLSSGYTFSSTTTYNGSLTRSTASSLRERRSAMAATTVNNRAVFAGGYALSYYSDVVDVYNSSLTRSTANALTVGRTSPVAASVGDYALVGGGLELIKTSSSSTYVRSPNVDAYKYTA